MATTIAATTTTTPPADRRAPVAYLAHPRTLAERLRFLEADARRILAAPEQHRAEEVDWAHAMLRAGIAETR
jgi:hypothetical protein